MKHCKERGIIDKVMTDEIEAALVRFGVPKEEAYRAYDAICFRAEARAVLLNRVQDRKMSTAGINYYGQFLTEVADRAGVRYDPDQPV